MLNFFLGFLVDIIAVDMSWAKTGALPVEDLDPAGGISCPLEPCFVPPKQILGNA